MPKMEETWVASLPGVRRPVGALVGCDLSQPFFCFLDKRNDPRNTRNITKPFVKLRVNRGSFLSRFTVHSTMRDADPAVEASRL